MPVSDILCPSNLAKQSISEALYLRCVLNYLLGFVAMPVKHRAQSKE